MREDHGSVGCSADVRVYLDWKCSGRRRCQLKIPDEVLHAAHPCPKELMPYLEASYSCITGTEMHSGVHFEGVAWERHVPIVEKLPERMGTTFPLLKCLRTHYGLNYEPFSAPNALYCRILHIKSHFYFFFIMGNNK